MSHITLTVLPFEDLSHKKELGIFCRSFSNDLVTELSRFRQFQVISMPSPAAADNDFQSTKTFDYLKSDYFIQGTFRCDKDLVRINVQLYNSDTHQMIWGNRLEGSVTALTEIQDNLVTEIIGILQHQIHSDLLSRIRKRQKVDLKAYEHFLYGMEEIKKGSVESDMIAREHFAKAIEMQPDYSLAYTGMSLTYFNEWSCQLWDRWEISKNGAYEWAQKAIELDDHNSVAAMVLGKIFMFEGSYDTAEYYFRKSLLLNPNDPETILNIAVCFIFMGFEKESLELHERAIRLSPMNADKYSPYGIFIFFELGEFEKAAALLRQNPNVKIADADAYYAAIYYYLNQPEKMHTHWNTFLETYRRLISKGKDFTTQEAIEWINKIGPYRYKTNLNEFLHYITNESNATVATQKSPTGRKNGRNNLFVKDSAAWKVSYDGALVQVPELKGFYDLQKLLIEPRQLFHCAELMGSRIDGKGEKLIDDKARKMYQDKILELQNDMHIAEQHSDYSQVERLQGEYDQLIDHLSKSLGLKGKSRETGGTVEKARSAITWRIRNAIARIEQYHPPLGAHLANAVKTGTLCSYQPEREVDWITS
jgi:TolB-like protein/tetratricopeptide (TPR) repeat protein